MAENLQAGHGLVFYDPRFQQNVYAYRMPLYPAFLALFRCDVRWIRGVQGLIDATVVLAAASISRIVAGSARGRSAGLVAAILVTFNPFLIYFSSLILSETLFTAMLAWGSWLLLWGAGGGLKSTELNDNKVALVRRGPATLVWLLGGALLAVATLVRPSGIGLTVAMGVAATLAARAADPKLPTFRPAWPLPVATTMLLLTTLALLPWAYRNHRVVGAWVWTTTNSGVTAFDGFNPDADGSSNQKMLAQMPQLKAMNEVDRSSYLSSRALRFAWEYPERVASLAVEKLRRTWSPQPLSDQFGSTLYRLAGAAYSIPLDLLAFVGLWRAPVRRSRRLFLLTPALYFTLVHMASVGSLRYRAPVEPFLAMLAGLSILLLSAPKSQVDPWKRA